VSTLRDKNTCKYFFQPHLQDQTTLHCVPKKQYTKLVAITLSILNEFSKLCHCWKPSKFSTKYI